MGNSPLVLTLVFLCTSALAHVQVAPHPWAMHNATPARTGQSTYQGATVGTLDWQFPIAGVVPQIAVAADGSIYLGNVFNEEAWSNETYVYALNAGGNLKWRVKVKPYDWGAAQNVGGGPALDSAGNVIVPSTYTQLLKFTPAGDVLWTYQGYSLYSHHSSPAVLPDDTIRHTIFPAGLLGLSSSGATLFTGPGNVAGTVAVAPNGEMSIGGIRTQEPHGSLDIQYFNADGTLRWQRYSTFGAAGTPVFGPDGTLYAPFLGTAFYPDGRIKWTTDVRSGTAALGNNGVLYFPSGGVAAVDAATGARLWSVPIPGGVWLDPAIDSAGNIFVTTSDGYLWSVSPNGTVNWNLKLCDQFLTGPVVGATGNVLACGVKNFGKFVFSVK